jgi:UDP-N-acetylglucosamine--N-acetylmuramyl-(pentapeptide) pyrophosphoryl-undecaprenol N-acetylglucosamine transferase
MNLVEKDACVLVKDAEAISALPEVILSTLKDEKKCAQLRENIKALGLPNASKSIVEQILKRI